MIQSDLGVFYNGIFKDKRIDARANMFLSSLVSNGSAVINQCCHGHQQKIGSYRMMNNERCSETLLKQALYDSCRRNVQGQHLLCIQDTTEVNYFAHKQRVRELDADIGRLNNINYGYFCHPMLVVDPEMKLPLGFSSVKLWNRTWEKPNQAPRAYKKLPIEEKESFRWIDSVTQSRKNLPENVSITVIADRESDIYEVLCTIPRANTHLLIRSSYDRLLCQEGMLLSDKMRSCGIMHTYSLEIKGNRSRKSRTALIDMRYTSVELKRTAATIGNYHTSVKMNCIYVSERQETVPKGESPIEWRLYTTHQIETVEQAIQCVRWYRCRWYIEELFRLLKTDGLNIEASQLETGKALKKLLLFSLKAALQVMVLKIAYDQKREDCQALAVFTQKQVRFLGIILPSLEGRTVKQKNPFAADSLAWSAWIIARLGKWGAYKSQSPPGYITMKMGLDVFHIQSHVFELAFEQMKDVYKE